MIEADIKKDNAIVEKAVEAAQVSFQSISFRFETVQYFPSKELFKFFIRTIFEVPNLPMQSVFDWTWSISQTVELECGNFYCSVSLSRELGNMGRYIIC